MSLSLSPQSTGTKHSILIGSLFLTWITVLCESLSLNVSELTVEFPCPQVVGIPKPRRLFVEWMLSICQPSLFTITMDFHLTPHSQSPCQYLPRQEIHSCFQLRDRIWYLWFGNSSCGKIISGCRSAWAPGSPHIVHSWRVSTAHCQWSWLCDNLGHWSQSCSADSSSPWYVVQSLDIGLLLKEPDRWEIDICHCCMLNMIVLNISWLFSG